MKLYEVRILVLLIKKDLGTQPQPFVYVRSVLSQYSATPAKRKIFYSLALFRKEFADPWVKRTVPLNRIWEMRAVSQRPEHSGKEIV